MDGEYDNENKNFLLQAIAAGVTIMVIILLVMFSFYSLGKFTNVSISKRDSFIPTTMNYITWWWGLILFILILILIAGLLGMALSGKW